MYFWLGVSVVLILLAITFFTDFICKQDEEWEVDVWNDKNEPPAFGL